ncbi:MAG: hypothetical protein RLZZ453_294 [Chlamydiota bacterium]
MLARLCDYCLFYLGVGAITLSLPYFYTPFFYPILAALTPILWVPIEAFCVSRWGKTPGKSIFGLSVYSAEGFMLSYKEALKRALFLPKAKGIVRQKPVSLKRKLTATIASCVVMLSALYGNALALWSVGLDSRSDLSGWVQYASSEPGFKVAFPSDPEEIAQELVIPDSGKVLNYAELKSQESRKVSYSVSHLNLPRKWRWASNTTLLKGVLELIVKHSENASLLEKEFRTHGPHRVLDYRMKQGSEEMRGRLIIVGSTLYKLTVVYPPTKGDESQITAFLDSFEVN